MSSTSDMIDDAGSVWELVERRVAAGCAGVRGPRGRLGVAVGPGLGLVGPVAVGQGLARARRAGAGVLHVAMDIGQLARRVE